MKDYWLAERSVIGASCDSSALTFASGLLKTLILFFFLVFPDFSSSYESPI